MKLINAINAGNHRSDKVCVRYRSASELIKSSHKLLKTHNNVDEALRALSSRNGGVLVLERTLTWKNRLVDLELGKLSSDKYEDDFPRLCEQRVALWQSISLWFESLEQEHESDFVGVSSGLSTALRQ